MPAAVPTGTLPSALTEVMQVRDDPREVERAAGPVKEGHAAQEVDGEARMQDGLVGSALRGRLAGRMGHLLDNTPGGQPHGNGAALVALTDDDTSATRRVYCVSRHEFELG